MRPHSSIDAHNVHAYMYPQTYMYLINKIQDGVIKLYMYNYDLLAISTFNITLYLPSPAFSDLN